MITDQVYKKIYKFSLTVTGNSAYYKEEVAHAFIIKILEKKIDISEMPDSALYFSIRNAYIDILRLEKKNRHLITTIYNSEVLLEYYDEYSYDINKDKNITYRLKIIEEVVESLDYFSKKLYILHHINGLSQRKIARESGISHMKIHKKLKDIKEKIKERLDEKGYKE